MKMKLFDRVLLTIYTLLIIMVALTSFAIAWRILPQGNINTFINQLYNDWQLAALITVIGLLFLVMSLKLLFSGVKKSKPRSTLLKNTEFGMIRISLNTIDGLAQKSARGFSGIRDVKSNIVTHHDGVLVFLKISVVPDANIPQISEQLQKGVKEYIEKTSGIYVKEVQVYVDNPSLNPKSRVD